MIQRVVVIASMFFTAAIAQPPIKHRFIVADEGAQKVVLIDENRTPNLVWSTATPGNNRDLQLIGNNRVLVSCQSGGYLEINLTDGKIVKTVTTSFGATHSVRRLPNGNTVLAGDNLNGTSGITLLEVDSAKTIKRKVTLPNTSACRVVRRTWKETFLIGTTDSVYEVSWAGAVLWKRGLQLSNYDGYMALRLRSGNTLVACGYVPQINEYTPAGAVVRSIGGTAQPNAAAIHPYFYAGFQMLKNGQIIVANWQGHGDTHGKEGIQVLQYDTRGAVVWSYKDTSATPCYSSLHHAIVLDSLNTQLMHDDVNGFIYPVFGCMNTKSSNYDSLVIADDGSCKPVVGVVSYPEAARSPDIAVSYKNGAVSIVFPDRNDYSVAIHTLDGRLVFRGASGGGRTVTISRIPADAGVLILSVLGNSNFRATKRLVCY